MSYSPSKSLTITVRVTPKQRKMLEEMTREWGGNLSDVVRDIMDREWKRRKQATDWMVPTRRP